MTNAEDLGKLLSTIRVKTIVFNGIYNIFAC